MSFESRAASTRRSRIAGPLTAVGLFAALGIAFLVQATARALKAWVGEAQSSLWLALCGVGALVIVFVIAHRSQLATRLWSLTNRAWMRPDLLRVHGERASPSEYLVVVASLGPGIESAVIAMRHHRTTLRRVFALHTSGEAAQASLNRLRVAADEMGLPRGIVSPLRVPDSSPHDPGAVHGVLTGLLDELGPDADLVLDYTGGTKAFAAAMSLAAVTDGRRLEYVVPDEIDAHARAVPNTGGRVIEVDLQFIDR